MGLFCRLASPVSVVVVGKSAARAVAIRIVVPEFAASIHVWPGADMASSTCIVDLTVFSSAPKARHAFMVDTVSSDIRASCTLLPGPARDAKNMARCV